MKKLLYTLAVATLALFTGVACTNDPTVASFDLEQLEVNLTYEVGKASVPYTLGTEGEVADVVLGEPTASWIHHLAVDKENKVITFEYDANCFHTFSTEPREASFTVKYGELSEFTVTLHQEALQVSPFNLSWTDVTPTSCHYTCTPDDPTEFYLIGQVEKSGIESFVTGGTWGEKVYAWAKNMVDTSYEECINGNFPTEAMLEKNPDINTFYNIANIDNEEYKFKPTTKANLYDSTTTTAEAFVYVIGVNMDFLPVPFAIGIYAPEFPVNPTIEFASPENSVGCGAQYSANQVTITNAGDYGSVVVRSTDKWITATYNAEKSMVEYEIAENKYNRTRSAKVELSYESATGEVFASASFVVNQAANTAAEEYTFDFNVVSTHWDHAVLSVIPSNKSVKYIVGGIYKGQYDGANEKSDDVLVNNVLNSTKKIVLSGDNTTISVPINTDWYEFHNWYFYVFAVNDDESEPTSNVTKILVEKVFNDKPNLAWADGERVNVPATGGTFQFAYKFVSEDDPQGLVTNIVEGGAVRINAYPIGGAIDDQWGLLKKNPPVVDEAKRVVTLEINEYDPSKSYHYVSISLVYYNKITDVSYGGSPVLKVVQEAPAQ